MRERISIPGTPSERPSGIWWHGLRSVFSWKIDAIERIALVPLTVFYLNYLFHIKITAVNSFIVILLLIAIPLGYVHLRDSGKLAVVRGRMGF